jgi:hypothetical protein
MRMWSTWPVRTPWWSASNDCIAATRFACFARPNCAVLHVRIGQRAIQVTSFKARHLGCCREAPGRGCASPVDNRGVAIQPGPRPPPQLLCTRFTAVLLDTTNRQMWRSTFVDEASRPVCCSLAGASACSCSED